MVLDWLNTAIVNEVNHRRRAKYRPVHRAGQPLLVMKRQKKLTKFLIWRQKNYGNKNKKREDEFSGNVRRSSKHYLWEFFKNKQGPYRSLPQQRNNQVGIGQKTGIKQGSRLLTTDRRKPHGANRNSAFSLRSMMRGNTRRYRSDLDPMVRCLFVFWEKFNAHQYSRLIRSSHSENRFYQQINAWKFGKMFKFIFEFLKCFVSGMSCSFFQID